MPQKKQCPSLGRSVSATQTHIILVSHILSQNLNISAKKKEKKKGKKDYETYKDDEFRICSQLFKSLLSHITFIHSRSTEEVVPRS